jgi:hypothetical protein
VTPERFRGLLGGLTLLISTVVVATAFTAVPHTGGDNAGYIALAHGLLTDGAYLDVFDPERMKHTKYPPVFPGLLAVMIALGARTWGALKLAAAIPTVFAVGATFVWAERRVGAWPALAIGVLLTVSSGVVYYSHWVLSDPLFLALTMLALASFARSEADARAEEDVSSDRGRVTWLIVGVMATGLAYFTRSAGLPLVLALFGWLTLGRRWRALAGSAFALGIPMLAWWLRGQGEGVAQYGTEFWMVNPYDPAQGTIGVFGLGPRVMDNAAAYVFQHGPAGVVGADGPALAAIGLLLTLAAAVGWILSIRERVGVAELFVPLYAGLILVWPAVWGGDRFVLPLYPLVFVYGFMSIRLLASRLPSAATPVTASFALLALLLPAGGHWLDGNRQSGRCDAVAAEQGAWACYGARVGYFVRAASWTADGLPGGSAVLSRKPRHFYLQSGHPSRTFPFDDDPATHLELADRIGARFVLLDQWDGQAVRYLGAAVTQRPDAFCYVGGFGQPTDGGAQLLGILPPAVRGGVSGQEPGRGIEPCPESFTVSPDGGSYSSSFRIPLLESLDS